MQKSPSHCAGRWSYLVNPLLSSLGYKEKKKEKKAAQSFSQYLPLGLINCDSDLNKSQYLLIIIHRHLFICPQSLYNESPISTGNFTLILNVWIEQSFILQKQKTKLLQTRAAKCGLRLLFLVNKWAWAGGRRDQGLNTKNRQLKSFFKYLWVTRSRERKALNFAIKYNKAASVEGKKRQQPGLTGELVLMEHH